MIDEISFGIVEKINKKYNRILIASMIVFAASTIGTLKIEKSHPSLTLFLKIIGFSVFILYTIFLLIRSFVYKDFKIVGKIIFCDVGIKVIMKNGEKHNYLFDDLKSIKIWYRGYEGQPYIRTNRDGLENEIIFKTNTNVYRFNFLITNKYWGKQLLEYIQTTSKKYDKIIFRSIYDLQDFFGITSLRNKFTKKNKT